MLKKTVTFEDFNGVSHTEDFYFNLSKKELMEVAIRDRLMENIERIQAEKDNAKIFKAMSNIILMAYGKKSHDGRLFIKSDDVVEDFRWSGAFDEVVFSVVQSPEEASEFIRNVVPQEMAAELEAKLEEAGNVEYTASALS